MTRLRWSAARTWIRRHGNAIALVALVTAISGSSLLWSARQQQGYEASLHHQHVLAVRARAREQAVQDHAGEVIEQKLCQTFGRLAALKPPPGNPGTNPSRAFEQAQHAILVGVGPDIGCKQGGTP